MKLSKFVAILSGCLIILCSCTSETSNCFALVPADADVVLCVNIDDVDISDDKRAIDNPGLRLNRNSYLFASFEKMQAAYVCDVADREDFGDYVHDLLDKRGVLYEETNIDGTDMTCLAGKEFTVAYDNRYAVVAWDAQGGMALIRRMLSLKADEHYSGKVHYAELDVDIEREHLDIEVDLFEDASHNQPLDINLRKIINGAEEQLKGVTGGYVTCRFDDILAQLAGDIRLSVDENGVTTLTADMASKESMDKIVRCIADSDPLMARMMCRESDNRYSVSLMHHRIAELTQTGKTLRVSTCDENIHSETAAILAMKQIRGFDFGLTAPNKLKLTFYR